MTKSFDLKSQFLVSDRRQPAGRAHRPLAPGRPERLARLGRLAIAGATLLALTGCGPLGLERGSDDNSSEDGAVSASSSGSGDDRVALVIEGDSITMDELHEHMQEQFLEEFRRQPDDRRFELEEAAVRDLVQRRVVDAAAAERGVTSEALFDEITGAATKPSVEEIASWYSTNQARLRGAKLEDVAGQINDLLTNESRSKAWNDFIAPRIDALSWQMVLSPPRKDLTATRLVRGPAEAPVTIMAFSDYQCPYCIRSEPVLAEVLERYPGQVRVIHRHFPLDSIHSFARPAAEAAMCADEQGQFWAYHDAIFARGGKLDATSLSEIGKELGLDEAALDSCIGERRYQDFVQADFAAGQAAGVTGTPAFFVNGIALKGARDADDLSRIVDSELARLNQN